MYHYIFFDLDGTLTDSKEGILNSLRYAFDKLGEPVPPLVPQPASSMPSAAMEATAAVTCADGCEKRGWNTMAPRDLRMVVMDVRRVSLRACPQPNTAFPICIGASVLRGKRE